MNRDASYSCGHIILAFAWTHHFRHSTIEIHIRNGIIRFKEGGSPHTWDGYIKRTVTISGRAFGMLGVGNGRDYINEVAD